MCAWSDLLDCIRDSAVPAAPSRVRLDCYLAGRGRELRFLLAPPLRKRQILLITSRRGEANCVVL
jgi:hypothetical protein